MSPIDLQPRLFGDAISLRPLDATDFEELYQIASDPQIWASHPDSERYRRDVFKARYFEGALASRGALAIQETDSGRLIGSSRYYEWNPDAKAIAVGFTFLERKHWGKGTNRELKQLMLVHIFQWVDTVWFHVGKINLRSRRAVEKLGATLCHEQERELEGNHSRSSITSWRPPGSAPSGLRYRQRRQPA